jgi:hypothetical protein
LVEATASKWIVVIFTSDARWQDPEFQATPAHDASYVLKLLAKTLDTEVTTVAEGGSFPLGKDHVSFVDLAAVLGAAEPLGAELAENEVGVLRRVRAADHDNHFLPSAVPYHMYGNLLDW